VFGTCGPSQRSSHSAFLPVVVAIERDDLAFGDVVDVLAFVRLAELLEQGARGLVAPDGLATEGPLGRHDAPHFGLDPREILVGEGAVLAIEVVVETRRGRGAEGDLGAREEQTLHRVGHHVRRGVADDRQPLRILAVHERGRGAFGQRSVRVVHAAPHFAADDRGILRELLGEAVGEARGLTRGVVHGRRLPRLGTRPQAQGHPACLRAASASPRVRPPVVVCRRDWVRTNDPYRVKVVLYR
jgi:hypothetical protein